MSRKSQIITAIIAVIAIVYIYRCMQKPAMGETHFFRNREFHFQTLRALGHIPYGGADTGDILATIRRIRKGDVESWFREWNSTAERVEEMANELSDPISKGRALLRAHNYYRTAEFFISPDDPRKRKTFQKGVDTFNKAINVLDIEHEQISVPYGEHLLKAIYYPGPPGADEKPLIVVIPGYDSTMEESYFSIAAAAIERGFSCLTYEGPGQGSIILEQGLTLTPEWEKPNSAVLDEFFGRYPRTRKVILIGISLGGYFAPRAAAFDDRIDGVVSFDVLYDYSELPLKDVPAFFKYLYRNGFVRTVNSLAGLNMKFSPEMSAGFREASWKTGEKHPFDLARSYERYNLSGVADKITCDVLILAGEKDDFVPIEQVAHFQQSLANARSITTRIFTEEEGGEAHCQPGAATLVHAVLFEWIEKTFGVADSA
jgi:pimeloyl-ACP methyl ester carboxylesterase